MAEGDTFTPADLNPATAEPVETTVQSEGAEPSTPAQEAVPAPEETPAQEAAAETEGQDPGEDPAAARKENPVQKRIDEITRQKYEAQREADYWRGVAEGRIPREEAPAGHKPQAPSVEEIPGLPPKPIYDDRYDGDYDAYVEDLAAWRFHRERLITEQEQAETRERETFDGLLSEHNARMEHLRQAKPDFDEVVATANVRIHNAIVPEIIGSEKSAEIMYYLATNPEAAARLNSLPVNQQLREIGRIEERLTPKEAPTPPPVKRVSQAPAPVSPVGSRETVAKNPDDMPMDEWVAYERERMKKRAHR